MTTTARSPALPRSRSRNVLLAAVATLALLLLGASVAVQLAKGAIRSKAESLAEGLGLSLEIGDVDVPLVGGIALGDVRVRRADGAEIAHLARVETDVTLLGAALGKRRPGRLTLVGGSALVRWDDGLVDLRRSGKGGDGGAAEALTVEASGLTLIVEARQTTPLGKVASEAVRIEGLEARLVRDEDRRVAASARGTFVTASHRGPVELELDVARGLASFKAEAGIEVGLESPRGPFWVALNGLRREAGQPLEAEGIGLRLGDRLLQIGHLTVRGGGDGWLPDPARLEGLEAQDITASAGASRATFAEAAVTLAPSERGPLPASIVLKGLAGRVSDAGRELSGRVATLEVSFTDLAAHLAANGPLDAVSALRLERPEATLVIPARAEAPAEAPVEPPSAPANDEPPPFLGNDDDLPPADAVVPALAPGHDWLGALLGAGEDGEAALDLVPADLRARLPAIVQRLGALAPKVSDGSLTVVDSQKRTLLTLQEAGFSASRGETGVVFDARAAVLRDGKEAGRADFKIEVEPDLTLSSLEGTLSGRSLAHQLARFVRHLSVQEDAEVDLQIRYERPRSEGAPHHVEGSLRLASFSFEYWRIADREIRDLEARVKFDASIDRDTHRLLLTLPEIQIGEARFSASLDLSKRKRHLPSFVARVEMPRQDCGAAARSIPKGLIPNLPTLALSGQIDFKASLTLDLENPRGLDLEVTGNDQGCEVLSLGPQIDLEALRGPFVHHPREPKGVLEHISVGRGTPEWVSSEHLPNIVKAAAWVTEDRRWLEHRGVRWDLVERALKIDLEHGRFIYGGSTITQQLVKNLYLTRDKNLARKLEEAIIAWQMERVLTKDEILTTYINCIEYGPEIYGIKQAARVYFGKRPSDLDALESAFIMGLKPYPKAGYNQFLKGELDVWWVRRVSHVLRYIAQFSPADLTPEEAEAFAPFQPAFRKP